MLRFLNRFILALLFATCFLRAADWPQWRGSERQDVSKEEGLLKAWPRGGPQGLWLFQRAGLGYAGISVVDGRLYTMGAQGATEHLLCVDAERGRQLWHTEMGPIYRNNWGDGPRGTPTVVDGRVYAMSGRGDLVCADTARGELIWKVSMEEDLGGRRPNWGYSESVLVDGDHVICTPGGQKGSIAALDRNTGKVVWRSEGFTEEPQYSSPVKATIHGKDQIIQLTMKKLVGVDPSSGKVLWQTDWPGRTAVIPTPVVHGNQVYITSGYGVGCKLVEIGADNSVKEVYRNHNMINHHGGVVLLDGYLYGYSDRGGWICQDFDTGEVVWQERGVLGKGAITIADGMMYCLAENDGTVVLAHATPDKWNEAGRFKLDPQSNKRSKRGKIWTHPVIANGKLYLRDQEIVYCFDISAD